MAGFLFVGSNSAFEQSGHRFRAKKTPQSKTLEPGSDSIRTNKTDHAERKTVVHSLATHLGERCPVMHEQYLPSDSPPWPVKAGRQLSCCAPTTASGLARRRTCTSLAAPIDCHEDCTEEIETDVETNFH
jgi:hypothetical protein